MAEHDTLAGMGGKGEVDPIAGAQRLRFPGEQPSGELYILRENDGRQYPGFAWGVSFTDPWRHLATAQGEVIVPTGVKVGLQVGDGCDLSPLAMLPADALHALDLRRAAV